jgi:hypothetical protein
MGATARFFNDVRRTFILHAVIAHANNGLVPVAGFLMLIAVATGDVYVEHTVYHLLLVALAMIPVSFFSGIRDWRTRFKGAPALIFTRKIRLTVLLFLLSGSAVVIRSLYPEVLLRHAPLAWLYMVCIVATVPVVGLLGHYGASLMLGRK